MNNKIKLSISLMLSVFALFSFFIIPKPASAMTCDSATLTGDVVTGTPPARARFTYSTSRSTVVNGGGIPTTVQTFYSNGPIEQYISGLAENTTYYFRLEVTNNYGTANLNINNFTTPSCQPIQQNPTVNISANPSTIQSGQSSNLSWNSQNATSCSISQLGNVSLSGNQSVYPTNTTTYTITCYGNNGQQASSSATVYVNQTQQICLDVNANNYGGIMPCTYNNFIQTCQDVNAINYRGVLPCRYNIYIQTCQDINAINYRGALPCSYNQVVVNNQPTVTVYSDQTSVSYNGSATVRWITTNASYCNASGGSVGWAGVKSIGPGSFFTGSLTSTKTFTLTCSNSFGTATDSETITVRAQTQTIISSPKPTPTSLVLITSSVDRNQPIVPTIDNTRPRPGDEINYTVNYQNIGTGAITNLNLQINLPLEVDYLSSSPNNPTIYGNTLVFNLGTLKANGQGTVTIRTRVRNNIPAGTNLNFPATLSYVDPGGNPQSVNANVSAQVFRETEEGVLVPLGANAFWAGFFPTNLFGWLFLLVIILILVYLAKYLFINQSYNKQTTTVTDKPSGKKTTTTTLE